MGTRHKHLYEQISSEASLQRAFIDAGRGKRQSHGYLAFNEYAQVRLLQLHKDLVDETWQPHPLRMFYVYEPKKRLIGAPAFSDRIVHHALCAVIDPIFDRAFLPWSFACRYNKGTHAGVEYVQSQMRRHHYTHFLKTDFRAFFPSIDRAILHREVARKISCKPTLRLFAKIVPPTGLGVPIGALTSQLSANIYGNILDQHLHHDLGVTFARYMDDVIVLGNDSKQLHAIKRDIEQFATERMHLTISRWQIAPTSHGIDFLGYRIWEHHKLLRKSSVRVAKRKITTYIEHGELDTLAAFIGSWRGHAAYADTANLRRWLEREYDVTQHLRHQRVTRVKSRDDMLQDLLA